MLRLPESLAVLRLRDFRLLFLGQSISLLGDGMVRVALPFAVLSVDASASAVGIVLAARMLPMLALLLVGGVVADRASRQAIMVVADVVRLVSQGAMAVLVIAGIAEVWSLAVLAAVGGAASGFFAPASTGLLPAIVPAADLHRANGLRATAMAGGDVLGPAVAGILVATLGAGWALAIDAATFGLSAVFLAQLRLSARAPAPAAAARSFLMDLREGWASFRSRRWVWSVVVSASLGTMFWAAWGVLGPVVAERELGGASVWGAVLAASGAGGLIGGVVAIRINPPRPALVVALAYALFGLPLGLLALGAPVVLLAGSALVSGLGLMLGNSLWESTLQRHVPAEALSRVSAYDWFGSMAFYPLGLALWGPIAAVAGVTASLWVAFALQLAVALALLAVPEIRSLTRDGPATREGYPA